MLKILLSYNRLTNAMEEYGDIKTSLDAWGDRIESVDFMTYMANEGMFQNALTMQNRVFINNDLDALITQNTSMHDTLIWTQEWARGLLNRVDDFANLLTSEDEALQSGDYMACSLGATELLYFDDSHCPQDSYYSGEIQTNTDQITDNSDYEKEDLDSIESLLEGLKSTSVDISAEAELIRDRADKQKRVKKVFDSLKVYGTGVQVLNDHVRVEFQKFPTMINVRMHNRSFNYEGDQADSTGYVYVVLLKEDGFTDEEIAKVKATSHMTPGELYGRWENLETQEDRDFCMSIIHGNYSDAFDTNDDDISDAAIDFAAAYHAGMIQVDENGNFIGNMDEFEKMNNAILDGHNELNNNPYVTRLAAAATVETNDAAITAASYYGSDIYGTLYVNYAKWQAMTALYQMEDNEIAINQSKVLGEITLAGQFYNDYDVSDMKFVYDPKTGTGSFTLHWDGGKRAYNNDDGSMMHGTEVRVSVYETQSDIRTHNDGNVDYTSVLEDAEKRREKAILKMAEDASVGLASACFAPAGIAMDMGFNMLQDTTDYNSADSISAYVKAMHDAGYTGNVKDMAGYITGQIADARGLSSEGKAYAVGAIKTTIAVADDIYAIYDLENQIDKDISEAENENKMIWLGSGTGYSTSDTTNRDYFFYMDNVVNPTVAAHLDVAQNNGLNNALGWTTEQTAEIENQIRNLDGVSDPQKERLLGYINSTGSSEGYEGYDYLSLDQNDDFDHGYGTFDNDMQTLNGICQDVLGENYDISVALRS